MLNMTNSSMLNHCRRMYVCAPWRSVQAAEPQMLPRGMEQHRDHPKTHRETPEDPSWSQEAPENCEAQHSHCDVKP
jgi:hypothetical protein